MSSPETIITETAQRHHVPVDDVVGPTRRREPTRARHEAMAAIRDTCELRLADIGALFGGRHHTTVLYALRQTRRTR